MPIRTLNSRTALSCREAIHPGGAGMVCCLMVLFLTLPVAASAQTGPAEETASHQRMLALLEEIRLGTDQNNIFLGAGPAIEARRTLEQLGAEAADSDRFRALVILAEEELRLGNQPVAIALFEQALGLTSSLPPSVPQGERDEVLLRLAVANLRYGETMNCHQNSSAEACILPIRGAAIHSDKAGSQAAKRYLLEFLSRTPPNNPAFVGAVWLLNVAAMTLGEHPNGLEARFRVPLEVFGSAAPFPRFDNLAPALGVDSFNLSGGVVFEDLDGDLDLDLFTTTSDESLGPRLFLNRGDGTFEDKTATANLEGLYGGLNLIHADYDNDGDVDLYVLRGAWLGAKGKHPNSLLRNDGKAHFTDVTFDAGLGDLHYPTQAAGFADYDNDGDLDLFVGNEQSRAPGSDAPSQLFRNNGDGTFEDVAGAAGVELRAFVKGVSWGDYDEDRYPDLYVSVLGGPNHLFHNRGDGTFVDVTASAGLDGPKSSFPVWFWDYDNDGHLDLYVSSYRGDRNGVSLVAASYFGFDGPWELAKLYKGDGKGGFRDVAQQVGLTRLHLPMGSNFGDLDNDGFLDFYLGTGYPDFDGQMPNVLYHNEGGRKFTDVGIAAGLAHLQKGHGIAFGDFDGDGDLDVFEQMGGAFPGDRFGDALYRNPGFGNHWLRLQLIGTTSNRSAIGARIRVDIVEAGQAQVGQGRVGQGREVVTRSVYRTVTTGGSFGGNPLVQTVGLGKAQSIAAVEVYWPTSDRRQVLAGLEMDNRYQIVEGEAEAKSVP
jgi:hypothetical protein